MATRKKTKAKTKAVKITRKRPLKSAKKVRAKQVKTKTKKVVKVSAPSKAKKKAGKTVRRTSKQPAKKVAKKAAKKKIAKRNVQRTTTTKSATKAKATKKTTQRKVAKKAEPRIENVVTDQTVTTVKPVVAPKKVKTTKKKVVDGNFEVTPYTPETNEEYMGEAMRSHFREILESWKTELLAEMNSTVQHLQTEPMAFADPVDRASQEEGFTLELRTRDREWKLIKRIEQSLIDLANGDYGYCEDCGAEIGLRRLEARPNAVKCIDCKTYQEIREKHEGSTKGDG